MSFFKGAGASSGVFTREGGNKDSTVMSIQLVIFDCDGVLVDTEPAANQVLWRFAVEKSLAITLEESTNLFTGLSNTACIEVLERLLGKQLPPDSKQVLEAREQQALANGIAPMPGVDEAIAQLLATGLKVCVASSGSHDKMRLTLGSTGLLPLFEGRMFSATQVAKGKPHPDLFLLAAADMGVCPSKCVVIEDSLPGVHAAQAAAMRVLAYTPNGDPTALREAGAELFTSMENLPSLVSI